MQNSIASGKESVVRRLLLFAGGGAIAGLLCAPLGIAMEFAIWAIDSQMPLLEFADVWSPLGPHFWPLVAARLEIVVGAPIGGVLYGTLIGVFARGPRNRKQILRISIWVGSLLACLPLIMVTTHAENARFVFRFLSIMFPLYFLTGALFGGATAFFAGIIDRLFRRSNPAPDESTGSAN